MKTLPGTLTEVKMSLLNQLVDLTGSVLYSCPTVPAGSNLCD